MPKEPNKYAAALVGVAAIATIAVLGFHFAKTWWKPGPSVSPPLASTTRRIVVPNGSAQITINQRAVQPLPGSRGQVLLEIGDITRGQVIASISTGDGESLVGPVSLTRRSGRRSACARQPQSLDERTPTLPLC